MAGLGAYPVCSEWVTAECLYDDDPRRSLMTRWLFNDANDAELVALTAGRTALATQAGRSTVRQLVVSVKETSPVTLTRLVQLLQVEPDIVCATDGTVQSR